MQSGARIAQYAGKHLHKIIIKRPEYSNGDLEAAIKQVYLYVNQLLFYGMIFY